LSEGLFPEARHGTENMQLDSHRWFTLRVPASSANLGPGFDALGLALGVYLTCRFRRSETLSIEASGRDAASIPDTPDNLIWQTALSVAEAHCMTMPPIELHIRTTSRWAGMGSERR
jgi:homoserine kinase